MAESIDTFQHFLNNNNMTLCHPSNVIEDVLNLLRDNFEQHRISITKKLNADIKLIANTNELSHVLLSILINTRDSVFERNIQEPEVHISLSQQAKLIIIIVTDNAGGISIRPIESIFQLGISSKPLTGSGLGLYMAHKIIKERFSGTLSVKNTSEGASFIISIPIND
tara:strand:+ start:81362 stop:81865 length:504 start_codon:yes stop_codon:yes gene_type:complete